MKSGMWPMRCECTYLFRCFLLQVCNVRLKARLTSMYRENSARFTLGVTEYLCINIYIYIYICVCVCVRACVCVYVYICMCVYIYVTLDGTSTLM